VPDARPPLDEKLDFVDALGIGGGVDAEATETM
jgi:hypothetical protein